MAGQEELRAEIAACTQCSLARGRVKTVPGEGPANARIMF
ncbi:MAG: uracil-DNA glycosylase, partial [Chloroflexi bacterium]|nr:uracil-DNA glycosylase [Chloroflexota bacterium]